MSSNFLQRFKGKTQTISKDGVHNILGGSTNNDALIYTHSNGLTNKQKQVTQSQQTNSFNFKNTQEIHKPQSKNKFSKTNTNLQSQSKQPKNNPTTLNNMNNKQKIKQPQPKPNNQNPFLQSNPFYLDEEERQRQQEQRKRLEKIQKLQKLENEKKKLSEDNRYNKEDPKKGTYSSSMNAKRDSVNSVSKKAEKQWVKMGGLGPNIGGEEWQQKKKKHQKMQQFANQVKAINTQKGGMPPKVGIQQRKQEKKDDPRTKALQYSKKVPKPVVRTFEREQEDVGEGNQVEENELSELQQYELRHKQLQEMLRNQL